MDKYIAVTITLATHTLYEPRREKNRSSGISDQVRHKLGCTTTGRWARRREILDLGSRGYCTIWCRENKGADQLLGYCEAELCLCVFVHGKKKRFSYELRLIWAKTSENLTFSYVKTKVQISCMVNRTCRVFCAADQCLCFSLHRYYSPSISLICNF